MEYIDFIRDKSQLGTFDGFDPLWNPDFLYGFQGFLVDWSLRKGKSAIFADCGLGKTVIELVWAQNIVMKENKPVLIVTPLAVGPQTMREGDKFGIECVRSKDGKFPASAKIIITNYERLHYFNPDDFSGMVCDESSILKNFNGVTKAQVTEFMRMLKYRALCTATAAPNDYIELGTSSEALGELGYMDMLNKFFKRDQRFCRIDSLKGQGWRFRGHAEKDFWRWVCSWARAVRYPSDLGFEDGPFILPPFETRQHTITSKTKREGWLIDLPAITLAEQREERRRTLIERCEKAAELVNDTGSPAVVWCHLNDEGDLLEKLIPDSVQVAGKDSDDKKEESFLGFQNGDIRVMVTKPTLAGFGLNWQHCSHQVFFPSHSFEQWYQGVRRSWRFGQRKQVIIDIVTSEGEANVLNNLKRKSDAASKMFSQLVDLMNDELKLKQITKFNQKEEVPVWL